MYWLQNGLFCKVIPQIKSIENQVDTNCPGLSLNWPNPGEIQRHNIFLLIFVSRNTKICTQINNNTGVL